VAFRSKLAGQRKVRETMPQLTLASEFPKATEDDWRERVAKTLKGRSFDSLVTETLDGIELQPLYRGAAEPAPVPRRGVAEPPWTIMQRVDIRMWRAPMPRRARIWRTEPAVSCWCGPVR
jgi:hypothetical protein